MIKKIDFVDGKLSLELDLRAYLGEIEEVLQQDPLSQISVGVRRFDPIPGEPLLEAFVLIGYPEQKWL
jgi:hypothetical protein